MRFIDEINKKYVIASRPSRKTALKYVSFVLDPGGRKLPNSKLDPKQSILVGWQCGFEPLYVAINVGGYGKMDESHAEDLAREFLESKGWFKAEDLVDEDKECDYILMPE